MKKYIPFLFVLIVFFYSIRGGEAAAMEKMIDAPKMQTCEVGDPQDLGIWDDVKLIPNKEEILLLKDDGLYKINLKGNKRPELLNKNRFFSNSNISHVFQYDEQQWIFAKNPDLGPYGFNITEKKVIRFEVPNLSMPGDNAPAIRSIDFSSSLGGAIISVSGGDKKTWPRDGNRPIYFWLSLKSGKVVRLPTGWDMDYFSTDLKIAFFGSKIDSETYARGSHSIDMETGQASAEGLLNRHTHLYVPYGWQDGQLVKPCYIRNGGDYIAGVYYAGRASIFSSKIEPSSYMSTTDQRDGIIGFRSRRSGAGNGAPSQLWIFDKRSSDQPIKISDQTTNFTILNSGNCLYSVVVKNGVESAFFRSCESGFTWNVLGLVDLLEPLSAKYKDDARINERLKIDFYKSYGALSDGAYTLCAFRHSRIHPSTLRLDAKLLAASSRSGSIVGVMGTLPRESVEKMILVRGDGKRFSVKLSLSNDVVLPFASGNLVTGSYVWEGSDSNRRKKVSLTNRLLSYTND